MDHWLYRAMRENFQQQHGDDRRGERDVHESSRTLSFLCCSVINSIFVYLSPHPPSQAQSKQQQTFGKRTLCCGTLALKLLSYLEKMHHLGINEKRRKFCD